MSLDVQLMSKMEDGRWTIVCLPKKAVLDLGFRLKKKEKDYDFDLLIDPKTNIALEVTNQDDTEFVSYCVRTNPETHGVLEKLKELGQNLFPNLNVELINDCEHYPIFWGLDEKAEWYNSEEDLNKYGENPF